MSLEQFSNLATTTLSGTISDLANSLVVTSASKFPVAPQFRIVVESEIMIVTGVSGTTWSVTRGAEGTSSASHATGVAVSHILTTGNLVAAVQQNSVTVGTVSPSVGLWYDTTALYKALKVWNGASWDIVGASPLFDGTNIKLPSGGDIRPYSDSVTAINIAKADGTDFVTFDTTNSRVGIGTASPSSLLEINAGTLSAATDLLRLSSTNNGGNEKRIAIYGGTSGTIPQAYIGSAITSGVPYSANLTFATANAGVIAEKVRIDFAGNVGIGTTAPSYALSFDGSTAHTIGMETSPAGAGSDLTLSSSNSFAGTDLSGGGLILSSGLGTGTGTSTISFQTGTTLTTGSTAHTLSTKMTILGSGNVGIGTIAPSTLLEISKSASGAIGPEIMLTNPANMAADAVAITFKSGLDTRSRIMSKVGSSYGSTYSGDLYFQAKNYFNNIPFQTRMYIEGYTGKVGIGTITPASHLQIGGDIIAASWSTTGIAFDSNAAIYTDNTSGVNAVIPVRTANSFGAPTFASTNLTTTITDAFTLYVPKPIAGTNTTITRANSAYFEGAVGIGTAVPQAKLHVYDNTTASLYIHKGATNVGETAQLMFGTTTAINNTSMGGGIFFERAGAGGLGNLHFALSVGNGTNVAKTDAKMTILNSGNVGIGTITPAVSLQVGDGTTQETIRIRGSGIDASPVLSLFSTGSREGFVAQTYTNMYVGNTAGLADFTDATLAANAAFTVSTTNAVNFPQAVTVGDLRSPDSSKLLVFGGDLAIEGTTLSNGASMGAIKFGPRIAGSTSYINKFPIQIQAHESDTGSWSDNAYMSFYTTYGGDITANTPTEKMRILGNGNIGIGATIPTALLQVSQPTTGIGTVSINGSATVTGNRTQFNNTFKAGDTIVVNGETKIVNSIISDTSLTTTVSFAGTGSSLAYTLTGGDRFVVRGNGNIGIGTTTPTAKLDVNGSINLMTSSAPTVAGNNGQIYTKIVDSVAELFYTNGQGYTIQLTNKSGGAAIKNIWINKTSDAPTINIPLNISCSDGTNWNVQYSYITSIKVTTASTNWDLWLCETSAYDTALISSRQISANRSGAFDITVNRDYNSDATVVYLVYTDYSGANVATIYITGEERTH